MLPKPPLLPGAYVLATKFSDGDPHDHWVVGFLGVNKYGDDRFYVQNKKDKNGVLFRANGFKRAEQISANRGAYLLRNQERIEKGDRNLWWWARRPILREMLVK